MMRIRKLVAMVDNSKDCTMSDGTININSMQVEGTWLTGECVCMRQCQRSRCRDLPVAS